MKRILATGDWHAGAGSEYGAQPGDRLRDQARTYEAIAELAIEQEVDAVLVAGDVFHRPRPAPETLLALFRPFRRLREAGIDVLAITGNAGHDIENAERACALDLFGSWIDVHRRPSVWPGPVAVATLPSVPPGHLVAARGGGDRDALHGEVASLLIDTARGLRAEIPATEPAILLLHWSISGAVTPTGADVGIFREPILPLHELEALGFDAVVAGHIHKPQLLSPNGSAFVESENGSHRVVRGRPILYVGSPSTVDFGEAESQHGVWLLDFEDGAVDARFVEIKDRPFVTVSVDLTTATMFAGNDETDVVAAAIAERLPLTDAVVRLRYRASAEQARRIDVAALRGFCADAGVHRVYAVQAEIVREDRARVEGLDESLSELDALERWIETQGVDDAPAKGLRELTTRYLETAA